MTWSLVLALLCGLSLSLLAEPVRDQHTVVELVAENESLKRGETNWLALRMQMDETWHTYWQFPGEAGQPTELSFAELPEGVSTGDFRWPVPQRYSQGGIMNYVYEGEVFLLFPLEVPASFGGDRIKIAATATFLQCDPSICVPGEATVELTLPVSDTEPEPSKWADALADTRNEWPVPLDKGKEAASITVGSGFRLAIYSPEGWEGVTDAYFFSSVGQVAPSAMQDVSTDEQLLTLHLEKDSYYRGDNEQLPGVLKVWHGDEFRAFALSPEVTNQFPEAWGEQTGAEPAEGKSFLWLLLLAFLGGLILNLMPCVFPVIGLKVMSFVKQGGRSRGQILLHAGMYTLGILLSFWVLAGILLVVRASGGEAGWGFQMQNTTFVLALTFLFLLFALNLSGVFEVGLSAVGVGSSLASKEGLAGSFFSGLLATMAATPCSAPFLGTALGATVTVSAGTAMAIFTFIALGLAAPYVLLSAQPALARRLPKPGPWMDTFKQAIAFLLYGAVAYLLWVVVSKEDVTQGRLLNILFALTLTGLAAWLFGRFGQQRCKTWGVVSAALVLVFSLWLGLKPVGNLQWEPWSRERVEELREEGRPIYVDFTATWCLNCQFNKTRVFGSEAVRDAIAEHDVALLKADWTDRNDRIARELARFGRNSIPFNLIYGPSGEPIVLPTFLDAKTVLQHLDQALKEDSSTSVIAGSKSQQNNG